MTKKNNLPFTFLFCKGIVQSNAVPKAPSAGQNHKLHREQRVCDLFFVKNR